MTTEASMFSFSMTSLIGEEHTWKKIRKPICHLEKNKKKEGSDILYKTVEWCCLPNFMY